METGRSTDDSGSLIKAVRDFWRIHIPRGGRVCVALSGGIDSVVLLDLLYELRARDGSSFTLQAVHVDHGISSRSGEWAEFCRQLCVRSDVPLTVEKAGLDASLPNLEARARKVRRDAFGRVNAGFVALAHHLDDQIETFMFRAFRGSGISGLAGMSSYSRLSADSEIFLVRPLLGCGSEEIADYAKSRQLDWVEDETNQDSKYSRNFIRNQLLPLAGKHFTGYRSTLPATLRGVEEANGLLEELACLDHRFALHGDGWSRSAFREIGPQRTANWLSHLIDANSLGFVTGGQIAETARQICLPSDKGAGLSLSLGRRSLATYGDDLYIVAADALADNAGILRTHELDGTRQYGNRYGRLTFHRDDVNGIKADRFGDGRMEIRPLSGGERIPMGENRPDREVRDLLREARVPPWVRSTMPLVYVDNELAAVPNVKVSIRHQAESEEGYFPIWDSQTVVSASTLAISRFRTVSDGRY